MKAIIYVNWCDNEILTERDRANWIKDWIEDMTEDRETLDCYLEDHLCLTPADIWMMDMRERDTVRDGYQAYMAECATEHFEDEYEKMEIEV